MKANPKARAKDLKDAFMDQWNNKYIPLIQIVEETPIESEEGIYFVEKYQDIFISETKLNLFKVNAS